MSFQEILYVKVTINVTEYWDIRKMGNPEKLATQGTHEDDKQNKNNPEKLATQGTHEDDKQNKNTT